MYLDKSTLQQSNVIAHIKEGKLLLLNFRYLIGTEEIVATWWSGERRFFAERKMYHLMFSKRAFRTDIWKEHLYRTLGRVPYIVNKAEF